MYAAQPRLQQCQEEKKEVVADAEICTLAGGLHSFVALLVYVIFIIWNIWNDIVIIHVG